MLRDALKPRALLQMGIWKPRGQQQLGQNRDDVPMMLSGGSPSMDHRAKDSTTELADLSAPA